MNHQHVRERGELRPSNGFRLSTPCLALVFQRLLPRFTKEEVEAQLQGNRRIHLLLPFRNVRRWDTEAQDVHIVDAIPHPMTSQTLQALFQSKRKDFRWLSLSCDAEMG